MRLGHIAAKYESGTAGVGTISSGRGDPGGKSYGVFQMALKTGTLGRYIRQSEYSRLFDRHKLGSKEFDRQWKNLAAKYARDFEDDQYEFIHQNHYAPVRRYATEIGVKNTPAINEALFSMGVQHGKANTVVWRAKIKDNDTEMVTIAKLYEARRDYVQGLRSLSAGMKKALRNRYAREEADVTALKGGALAGKAKKPLILVILAFVGALIAAYFGA